MYLELDINSRNPNFNRDRSEDGLGRKYFPQVARKLVSRIGAGRLDPAIFNHTIDEVTGKDSTASSTISHAPDGYEIGKCPDIMFGYSQTGIKIIGMGHHGFKMLMNAAPTLNKLFNAQYGKAEITMKTGVSRIARAARTAYWAPEAIIKRNKSRKGPRWQEGTIRDGRLSLESTSFYIKRAIKSGIISQAHLLDGNVEGPHYSRAMEIKDEQIEIVGGNMFFGNRLGYDCDIMVNKLFFTMPFKLEGYWAIGSGRNAGSGRVGLTDLNKFQPTIQKAA